MVKTSEKSNPGFLAIYLTGFLVILAIAVMGQLLHLSWRTWFPGAEGDKSVIHAVNDSVYTFMSHLT